MTLVSSYPNQMYEVFDTIQAAAADITVSNGVLSVGNPLRPICNWDAILPGSSVTAAVAETSQITTITPTAANNSLYEFNIVQYNPVTGASFYQTFSYTTAASGDTATTIGNAFRSQVNAATAAGSLQIAATGTTTLILTAASGYPTFIVGITETGGGFSAVTGTPGVAAVGTTAALAREGITVSGAAYTTVDIDYTPITGLDIKSNVTQASNVKFYLNEAATNYADLLAAFQYLLDGREVSAGGPANPEMLSKL